MEGGRAGLELGNGTVIKIGSVSVRCLTTSMVSVMLSESSSSTDRVLNNSVRQIYNEGRRALAILCALSFSLPLLLSLSLREGCKSAFAL